jgi:hypothetical protein
VNDSLIGPMATILIIDDEPSLVATLDATSDGYEVAIARDAPAHMRQAGVLSYTALNLPG